LTNVAHFIFINLLVVLQEHPTDEVKNAHCRAKRS